MANAFYSLYSHVSRTPLQKLEASEFNFSPVERIDRFRTSVRSEPRSPVERLKDTVNKMCLYTGSPRGSDSTSPQPSPRKRFSLPDILDVVVKTKTETAKKLDLGERDDSKVDFKLITDRGIMQHTVADPDVHQEESSICRMEMLDSKHADNVKHGENRGRQTDINDVPHSVRTSLGSSLSGETTIETEHLLPACQLKLDSCLTQSDARTAEINPATTRAYDLTCPQRIRSAHQASSLCQNAHSSNRLLHNSSAAESTDRCFEFHKCHTQTLTCEPGEDSHTCNAASSGKASHVDALESLPVTGPSGSYPHFCITVTGWEGEDVSLCSKNTADSCYASPGTSMQTPKQLFSRGEKQYLNPSTHLGLAKLSSNPQQVNSFELEEVRMMLDQTENKINLIGFRAVL